MGKQKRDLRQGKRILAISDTHCGSYIGLTPPHEWLPQHQPKLCDPNSYAFRQAKRGLFQRESWEWFAKTVEALKPIDVLLLNGDMIDGQGKSEDTEHYTRDCLHQVEVAEHIVKFVGAKEVVMTYGTAFHTGAGEDYEAVLARNVGARALGDDRTVQIEDVKFHFRHHIGSSGIPHGRATAIMREMLWDLLYADMGDKEKADILIRSHVHYCVAAWDPELGLGMTLPALQGRGTKYGRRCSGKLHYGFVHFDVCKGEYLWEAHIARLQAQKSATLVL